MILPTPDSWPDDLREVPALVHRTPALHYYERVGSTNDLALSLAAAGAPHGTAVLADLQEAGRGRRGRSWWSPPASGLYLSVVVRTGALGSHLPLLTLAAGVALAGAVRGVSGLPVELKWPNDLVIGRPWRKLAGILCESTGQEAVVVGMGVNLLRSAYPEDIADRATSVTEETGREVRRGALVDAVLRALDVEVARLSSGRTAGLLDEWRQWAAVGLDHAPVRWRDHEGEHSGTAIGVGDDGALLVRRAGIEGETRLVSGDVVWEMLTRG